MARSPFVWGEGGQRLTPEDVARQRQVAQALLQTGADFSPATGGLAEALGRGFSGWASGRLGTLARESEAAGREAAGQTWRGLQSQLGGSQAPVIAPQGSGMAPSISDGASSFGGLPPSYIREGLLSRGLPAHVADAFVLNLQDESGLNPGINEASPIVPGSRGGFGLAQWTGPRRRELEAFAAQRGVPVSDPDLQMDFLVHELGGSESRAAQSILSAPDTGSAAAAIVNQFLRPAEQHRARREARYTGGSYMQPSTANVSAIAEALADPWVAQQYGPVAEALMGQQMQMQSQAYQQQLAQQDPMYQAQLARAELELEQMRNPAPAAPNLAYHDGRVIDMNTGEVVQDYSQPDADESEKEQRIARLTETLMADGYDEETARRLAVNVADGRFVVSRDPLKEVAIVIDAATGAVVTPPPTSIPPAAMPDVGGLGAAPGMGAAPLGLQPADPGLSPPAAPLGLGALAAGNVPAYDPWTTPAQPPLPPAQSDIPAPASGRTPVAPASGGAPVAPTMATPGGWLPPTTSNVILSSPDPFATGAPAAPVPPAQSPPVASPQQPPPAPVQETPQGGSPAPDGDVMRGADAFGLSGWGRGVTNTVSDALGFGFVFPDAAAAQAYYANLGQEVMKSYADTYQRQPPSWVLETVRDLLPSPGSVWQGPETARVKLESMGNAFNRNIETLQEQARGERSPAVRQDLELQIQAAQSAVAEIQRAADMLASGQSGGIRDVLGLALGAAESAANGDRTAPEIGEVIDGWRYNGPDPASPDSWERVP